MLARFRVKNFLSFRELQEISLISEGFDKKNTHYSRDRCLNLLNSLYVFGPNSAGKSNLVKAIDFSRNFILGIPFLSPDILKRYKLADKCVRPSSYIDKDGVACTDPSYFEFQIQLHGSLYSYGFELEYNSFKILSEWLYKIESGEYICIYEIDCDKKTISSEDPVFEKFPNIFNGQILMLNRVARNHDMYSYSLENESLIKEIFRWFQNRLIVRTSKLRDEFLPVPDNILEILSNSLKSFDTGISEVVIDKFQNINIPLNLINYRYKSISDEDHLVFLPGNKNKRYWLIYVTGSKDNRHYYEVRFIHDSPTNSCDKKPVRYRIDQESLGTYRIIQTIVLIESLKYDKKKYGTFNYTLVIDEFECSLHTAATLKLIKYYHDAGLTKTQLLVTTHEYRIMDPNVAGREEIWFVDTDYSSGYEDSCLYSLRSFNEINKNFREYYLQGRYSAVPFIGNFIFDE